MENFEKQEEIVNYLNKYYYVKESYFFNRQHEQEWGLLIIEILTKVFCHGATLTENTLESWAISKGLTLDDYIKATGTKRLKACWSPEMAQDLSRYGVIDAEQELISILSEELAREIDVQILLDLKGKVKSEEFLGIMECVGYTTTPLIYDPMTFEAKRGFISMNYHDIQYARQNNTIWKNWVRTREQNQ